MGYLERMEELLLTNTKDTTKESYKTGYLKSTENFYNQEIRSLNMEKELKISAHDALKAYKNADNYGKKILEDLFGKDFYKIDIKERVKCLEGAVAVLGMNNQTVKDYYAIARKTSSKNIIAFTKLRVIAEALNEGWKPNFNDDELRYYPWFHVYTKEEYEELNEDEKKEFSVVGRSFNGSNTSGSLLFACADYASSNSFSFYGSRIAFKTKELAKYCGKQFIDIWKDFLFG